MPMTPPANTLPGVRRTILTSRKTTALSASARAVRQADSDMTKPVPPAAIRAARADMAKAAAIRKTVRRVPMAESRSAARALAKGIPLDRTGGFGGEAFGRTSASSYGRKSTAAPRYGEGRPSDRTGGYDGERSGSDERRSYGKKPFGGPKFGGKPAYGRKPAGKFGPKRPYGERGEGFRPDEGAPKRYGAKPAGGFRRDDRRGDERPRSYPRYNPNVQTGEMRLNRFIAQSGLCSRREADDYIQAGLSRSTARS